MDREGPDQPAHVRRLIWAFAVLTCQNVSLPTRGSISVYCVKTNQTVATTFLEMRRFYITVFSQIRETGLSK